ncbi:PAS domain S-box-containing protein [Mucilaginibacter pineti]|uniref:histidine kinase n=1 Tax=Mucilaginibacter pineti TaxID=1391627 RepID=A0A1G6X869_9SPHI|nr:PAS domain-containing sensor histidine kinase [Mucilaginibacter pineti]SDD73496.1 PAS domain S-box-containing protein [Mucilaginibacter pineti]
MGQAYQSLNNDHSFLRDGGEMGELVRAYDWSKNQLGTPDTWPQSLKTTLSIVLNSKFPMFLFWGPELICFYNDAYRPSLGNNGKHPAIGLKAETIWPEIWADIYPLIDNVLKGGEANWSEDQLLPIYRNGQLEDVYWTFSYSPVIDESGKPAGVFVTCNETTATVIARQKFEESNKQLRLALEGDEQARKKIRESENNLRHIILQAPVAIAIFRGPQYIVEIVNARALELWGRNETEVLGLPILETMSELEAQGVKQLMDDVYTSGIPYWATEMPIELLRQGQMETAWINFVYEPLFDAEGNINGLITTGTEVTAQVMARKKIEDSEERFRQALESGDLGTWSLDPETFAMTVSDRFKEIFGYAADEEVLPDDIFDLIDADYRDQIRVTIQAAVAGNLPSDIEYSLTQRVTKERRWVRATGKMFFDDRGNPVHYSGMLMDITERKMDDIRKNDFIGMVSHELKTPLTSLSAYAQMLQARSKKSGDEFAIVALDKVNIQVKKMSNMINGFLNISRLESGKILIVKQVFNLDDLINEMIEETKLTVSSHQINFNACTPIVVNADRDKIASVIANLLSNAIKYSPKGKNVNVECGINDGNAIVSIKDEGMGIKPQDREKLFDRYYRVETKHTKHISGFGIGLYLSAEIIQRHEGRIWVESESGVGSTFYFTIPLSA